MEYLSRMAIFCPTFRDVNMQDGIIKGTVCKLKCFQKIVIFAAELFGRSE